jgi:hypothetical protein
MIAAAEHNLSGLRHDAAVAVTRDRRIVWAVLALTALAAVLRALMAHDSLWGDELYLYAIVHGHGLGDALSIVHDTESTPPLYFVLAWAAARPPTTTRCGSASRR